jgi:hypothetical protein
MATAPRSFLLTVYEPPAAVLEDLASGRREHVADVATVGAQVSRRLAAPRGSDDRAGEDALVQRDGRGRRLDAEFVDERTPAREELT